jgi:creatinine amidohydrolase
VRIRFEENASPEIAEAARENAIAIVPLGCIEQHGPHLPVGCDLGRPIEAAQRAREKHGARALVLPTVPFGPATEHTAFAGTISLSFETWSGVVVEILASLVRDGFRRIVVAKGCGGHMGIEGPVYQFYCRNKRKLPGLDIRVFGDQAAHLIGKTAKESGIYHPAELHAGGVETSMMLATKAELVHLDRLQQPAHQTRPHQGNWWIAEDITDNGATGNPARCNADAGKRILNAVSDALCDFLGEMWRTQSHTREQEQ